MRQEEVSSTALRPAEGSRAPLHLQHPAGLSKAAHPPSSSVPDTHRDGQPSRVKGQHQHEPSVSVLMGVCAALELTRLLVVVVGGSEKSQTGAVREREGRESIRRAVKVRGPGPDWWNSTHKRYSNTPLAPTAPQSVIPSLSMGKLARVLFIQQERLIWKHQHVESPVEVSL